MKKARFRLMQLIPRIHYTKYRTPDGARWIAVWRMWLGKCYDILRVQA